MKNLFLLLAITGCFVVFSCKDKESERFRLLTDPVWRTDSLVANNVDASGAGGILEDFVGDVKFAKDGTGSFGDYEGTWMFNIGETQLIIESDSLPITVIADIIELTSASLKLKTKFPNPLDLLNPINIRMTFKPK